MTNSRKHSTRDAAPPAVRPGVGAAAAADPAGADAAPAAGPGHIDAGRQNRLPGGPLGCSNMKLRRLTRLVSRHYDAHLAQCGLKTTQYSLLATIADPGPLQQGELARLLSLDASTLTRNLRPLADAGLLTIEAGKDARSRQVSATAAGREMRVQARQHWKRAQLEFNAAISSERVAALHDVVDACYETLVAADAVKGDQQ